MSTYTITYPMQLAKKKGVLRLTPFGGCKNFIISWPLPTNGTKMQVFESNFFQLFCQIFRRWLWPLHPSSRVLQMILVRAQLGSFQKRTGNGNRNRTEWVASLLAFLLFFANLAKLCFVLSCLDVVCGSWCTPGCPSDRSLLVPTPG